MGERPLSAKPVTACRKGAVVGRLRSSQQGIGIVSGRQFVDHNHGNDGRNPGEGSNRVNDVSFVPDQESKQEIGAENRKEISHLIDQCSGLLEQENAVQSDECGQHDQADIDPVYPSAEQPPLRAIPKRTSTRNIGKCSPPITKIWSVGIRRDATRNATVALARGQTKTRMPARRTSARTSGLNTLSATPPPNFRLIGPCSGCMI